MKKLSMLTLTLALLVLVAITPAFAGNATLTLNGAPSSAKQGETKYFTITVGANGQINLDHLPASLTLQTAYAAGGGSTTNATVSFTAPSTPAAGCEVNTNGQHEGECKPAQNVSVVGSGVVNASITVPANLEPGPYTITISGSTTNGMDLPTPMPSFILTVLPGGHAPTVTINTPANNSSLIYGATVDASVTIESDTTPYLDSYAACYNGDASTGCITGTPVSLTQDSTDQTLFTGSFGPVTQLCTNTFSAYATNNAGSGKDSSTFYVHYNFGGWLPPITTAKFQRGRTLPVMFRVNGVNGPIDTASVTVSLDNQPVGVASVQYDTNGVPYYQLNVQLNVATGPHTFTVNLGDEACAGSDRPSRSYTITVK